jgi:hypothetical protein
LDFISHSKRSIRMQPNGQPPCRHSRAQISQEPVQYEKEQSEISLKAAVTSSCLFGQSRFCLDQRIMIQISNVGKSHSTETSNSQPRSFHQNMPKVGEATRNPSHPRNLFTGRLHKPTVASKTRLPAVAVERCLSCYLLSGCQSLGPGKPPT